VKTLKRLKSLLIMDIKMVSEKRKEQMRKAAMVYHKKNKAQVAIYLRLWRMLYRDENPLKRSELTPEEQKRRWYNENKEGMLATDRKIREQNPHRAAIYSQLSKLASPERYEKKLLRSSREKYGSFFKIARITKNLQREILCQEKQLRENH
jgi:hypothetical protein